MIIRGSDTTHVHTLRKTQNENKKKKEEKRKNASRKKKTTKSGQWSGKMADVSIEVSEFCSIFLEILSNLAC